MSNYKHPAYPAIGLMLIAFGLVSLLYARENPTPSIKQQDVDKHIERATTLPSSDYLVTLKITLTDGEVIRATQFEGGLIRIEYQGRIFGITPHIRDMNSGAISAKIFRITRVVKKGETVGEAIALLESLEVNKLVATSTNTDPVFNIQTIRVQESPNAPQFDQTKSALERYINDPPHICCITCGGTTACGCSVELGCGSCCSGKCCPNGG